MSNDRSSSPDRPNGFQLPVWLWVVVIVAIFGASWWQNRQADPQPAIVQPTEKPSREVADRGASRETLPDPDEPQHARVSPEHEPVGSAESPSESESDRRIRAAEGSAPDAPLSRTANPHRHIEGGPEKSYRIENQTIRDLNGTVVYKGTIDLGPTLERIEKGESNRHRNDGTNFQNREGRLPRKPAGYYKEYVHPTPGEHGPGPQRIILGKEGEIWYTPDHYKTFRQINPVKRNDTRQRGPVPEDQ